MIWHVTGIVDTTQQICKGDITCPRKNGASNAFARPPENAFTT
jgi:hypothetical protein